mmetsp:Transcript_22823/g.79707  ORF Transcript_22823/g.79707 Transcript_22823/m.79707 type:complete len:357 (+) Transcript_22823:1838-2908(+)
MDVSSSRSAARSAAGGSTVGRSLSALLRRLCAGARTSAMRLMRTSYRCATFGLPASANLHAVAASVYSLYDARGSMSSAATPARDRRVMRRQKRCHCRLERADTRAACSHQSTMSACTNERCRTLYTSPKHSNSSSCTRRDATVCCRRRLRACCWLRMRTLVSSASTWCAKYRFCACSAATRFNRSCLAMRARSCKRLTTPCDCALAVARARESSASGSPSATRNDSSGLSHDDRASASCVPPPTGALSCTPAARFSRRALSTNGMKGVAPPPVTAPELSSVLTPRTWWPGDLLSLPSVRDGEPLPEASPAPPRRSRDDVFACDACTSPPRCGDPTASAIALTAASTTRRAHVRRL